MYNIVCRNDQNENVICQRIANELNKKLEVRLTDHTTSPGAKVVHFVDTAANLSAVMSSVRLPNLAGATPSREPIDFALEYVAHVEFFQTRWR